MSYQILQGDCRQILKDIPSGTVRCSVTSPPYYGLRDYGVDGQIGLEQTPEEYVQQMVEVFREVRRVLTDDGTLWLNLGDSYAGSGKGAWLNKEGQKEVYVVDPGSPITKMPKIPNGLKTKDLIGIPWMVAFALRADGWYLRSDIIWNKPNCMPESVTDRPTKAHEYLFLLSKSERYFYNHEAIKENAVNGDPNPPRGSLGVIGNDNKGLRESKPRGSFDGKHGDMAFRSILEKRNKRSVWTVSTASFSEAHFATFPPKLIEPCILAGSETGDTILDPFNGAGTSGLVSMENNRKYIGIELNTDYIEISKRRLAVIQPVLNL